MNIQSLHNKRILIVGKGVEGISVEAYLKKNIPNATIKITDQTQGGSYLKCQDQFDIAVRSPSVHPSLLTIPHTTATNLFFGNCNNKVFGVTGSKGKSTTASLIYHFLSTEYTDVRFVGNIGNCVLDELATTAKKTVFVFELSSYQLMDLAYSPHIAVITSLFPEHMDFHNSVESYYLAKKTIISHQKNYDYFIFNPKYDVLTKWSKTITSTPIAIKSYHLPDNLPLIGEHNRDNINLALTAVETFGLSVEKAIQSLHQFKPLPHRLEHVGTFQHIDFYDDAISTTPESTIAGLNSIPNVTTLFLGGTDRGYDFSQLICILAEKNIANLVLFPDSGKRIHEEIVKQKSYSPNIFETTSMAQAVQFAFTQTEKGTSCLLSTASPSYSLWKNFQDKGNQFVSEIKKQAQSQAL